jgi:general secretion pathway protein F
VVGKFRYTAVDTAGKRTSGLIEAASAAAAADTLQRRHYLVLRADEVGKHDWLNELFEADLSFRRALPKAAVAHFTRELSVMLQAGQDVDHALRFLIDTSENKRAGEIMQAIRDQVRGGKSLAAALGEHPLVFSRLYISLVRAGEAGGQLADALAHLADLLERELRLAASIQSALIYPVLLLIASIGTIVLLLTYVLPSFTPIFVQAGAQLPTPTRILIAIGDFVRSYGGLILVGLLVAFLAAHRALRQPQVAMAVARSMIKVPVVGTLIRRVEAARLTRVLGTLLRNGVGLVVALGIARDVLGNLVASKAVGDAVTKVRSGERLAGSLAEGRFFPSQTIHLVQLGEETGRLSDMTLRAADIHDAQVQQSVQRLLSLLVPVVTIIMGLIVAGIVGSLLLAMLSLNDLAL